MSVPETFALILAIAEARGVTNIAALSGCWSFNAGSWRIDVNGHRHEETTPDGHKVPPFHALAVNPFTFGDIALISPSGGMCAAGVEDDLIAALRKELTRG